MLLGVNVTQVAVLRFLLGFPFLYREMQLVSTLMIYVTRSYEFACRVVLSNHSVGVHLAYHCSIPSIPNTEQS